MTVEKLHKSIAVLFIRIEKLFITVEKLFKPPARIFASSVQFNKQTVV